MTTQVIFTTQSDLKETVLKKLREDGITLKTLLNSCIKRYVEGKIKFGVTFEDDEPEIEVLEVTPDIQKEMDKLARLVTKINAAHR